MKKGRKKQREKNYVKEILAVGRKKWHWKVPEKREESMKKIYVGSSQEEIYFAFYVPIITNFIRIVAVGMLLVLGSCFIREEGVLFDGYNVKKESTLGKDKRIFVEASTTDRKKQVSVVVPKKQYSEKELEIKWKKAKKYVRKNYLGENKSAKKVEYPLNLMTSIPNNGVVVEWQVSGEGVIQNDGTIVNEGLEKKVSTSIEAILSYGKKEEILSFSVTILPLSKSKEQLFWENWQKQVVQEQKEHGQNEYFTLPREVEGEKIVYKEKKHSSTGVVLLGILLCVMAVPFAVENKMKRQLVQREKELKISYPEFVEHFVLLVGAGMTPRGAWERMVKDYEEKRKTEKKYVYEEMRVCVYEMENGMSEAKAYNLFGKRTGLLAYMKFCTLLVQNLKKGSDDLLALLNDQIADAFHERKEYAKELGEQAGTKLLMPMMLMLCCVFVLILYAAFQSM